MHPLSKEQKLPTPPATPPGQAPPTLLASPSTHRPTRTGTAKNASTASQSDWCLSPSYCGRTGAASFASTSHQSKRGVCHLAFAGIRRVRLVTRFGTGTAKNASTGPQCGWCLSPSYCSRTALQVLLAPATKANVVSVTFPFAGIRLPLRVVTLSGTGTAKNASTASQCGWCLSPSYCGRQSLQVLLASATKQTWCLSPSLLQALGC